MTEHPDPAADSGSTPPVDPLADLTSRELAEMVVELSGMVAGLRADVDALQHVTGYSMGQGRGAGGAVPRVWTRAGRTRTDWDALVWWVDEMATAHAITALPLCWPAHERLVLELDAIRSAWVEAQAARNQGPSSLLASWYHYTWWPFWDRIDHEQCRGGHWPDPLPTPTDTSTIPCPVDEDLAVSVD